MVNKKFIVYIASAGSGKTFALIKEYLKLIFICPQEEKFNKYYFRHILSITFTNDATKELRLRVQKELDEIIHNQKDNKMLDCIIEELLIEYPQKREWINKNEFIRRAKEIKKAICFQYSDFSIFTIDAFQTKIANTFKRELKLQKNRIIDIKENTKMIDAVMDTFFEKIGNKKNKELTSFITKFMYKEMREGRAANMGESIKKYLTNSYTEKALYFIKGLKETPFTDFLQQEKKLTDEIKKLEKQVIETAKKTMENMGENGIEISDFAGGGNSGLGKWFCKYGNMEKFKVLEYKQAKKTVYEEGEWYSSKATEGQKEKIDTQKETYSKSYIDMMEKIKQWSFLKEVGKNFYEMGLSSILISLLLEEKKKYQISDLLETAEKINDIVQKEPIPYIYERLGERYEHILIDEFQDTSLLQWSNLIPLISNCLAKNGLSMLVGDPKQSIYQWRGTDSKNLTQLPRINHISPLMEEEHGASIQENFQIKHLDTNYRSKKIIVAFNNDFFSFFIEKLNNETIRNSYKTIVQKSASQKEKGRVEVAFLEKKKGVREAFLQKKGCFPLMKKYILGFLQKGFQKKDIVILFRSNQDISDFSTYLCQEKIPFKTLNSSILLKESPIVSMIITFLKFVVKGREDETVFVSLIVSIWNYIQTTKKLPPIDTEKIETLIMFFRENPDTSTDFAIWNHFFSQNLHLHIDFKEIYQLSIFPLVKEICSSFTPFINENDAVFITSLQQVVFDFSKKEKHNVNDFIEYWEDKKDKLYLSATTEIDALYLTTVHKAKGLEFPIVIYPEDSKVKLTKVWKKWDKDWGANINLNLPYVIFTPQKNWDNSPFEENYEENFIENTLEELNVFYVALTRATTHLVIISNEKTDEKANKETHGKKFNSFLLDFVEQKKGTSPFYKKEYRMPIEGEEEWKYTIFSTEDTEIETKEEEKITTDDIIKKHIPQENVDYLWQNKTFIKENSWQSKQMEIYNDNTLFGLAIHRIFSLIDRKEDIDKAIQMNLLEGWITKTQVKGIQEMIASVLMEPILKDAFGEKKHIHYYNEQRLCIIENDKTYILRPDRLVYNREDKTMKIIDYKTGEKKKEHIQQLEKYKKSIEDIDLEVKKIYMILIYCSIDHKPEIIYK